MKIENKKDPIKETPDLDFVQCTVVKEGEEMICMDVKLFALVDFYENAWKACGLRAKFSLSNSHIWLKSHSNL